MIEILENHGSGFSAMVTFEGWKVAFITYSEQYDALTEMKRHMETDEVFALLRGTATIYTLDDRLLETEMESGKLYNVQKGTWHHVKVSPEACLLVVENSNTTKNNTERMIYHAHSARD